MIPLADLSVPRRTFLATVAATIVARLAIAAEAEDTRIIGFIKPFQKSPPEEIARIALEAGWGGIELPVRKGGTIEPERVEDELPRFAEQMRKAGVPIQIIATDVEDPGEH